MGNVMTSMVTQGTAKAVTLFSDYLVVIAIPVGFAIVGGVIALIHQIRNGG